MKRTLLLLLITFSISVFAQQKYTISGYVEDADSGEKLNTANIFDLNSGKGAVSNVYGFYSLTIEEGDVDLIVSYVGFEDKTTAFTLDKDMEINFQLAKGNELDELTITTSSKAKIHKKTQMSQIDVKVSDIEKIPTILGEVDVLKTLQLLPGVQGGTEGLNGVYVRGGSPDQNLIILDGVPVYNVSHIMGFLSVFNTDAIKNVTLTKGGFPARYGGRLSSVIEIHMKEGNNKEFHGEGAIGLLSSRLTLEGPLQNEKTSFMISGRRNYIDQIAKPFLNKANKKDKNSTVDFDAYFYDLNAKVNHKIDDKHTIYASAYLGSDVFGSSVKYTYDDQYGAGYDKTDLGIDWGNIISALRWNYKINNKLFANTTLTYSEFDFDFHVGYEDKYQNDLTKFLANYTSGINDWAGKVDFDYIPNSKHYVRFGAGNTYHTYNPGAIALEIETGDEEMDEDIENFGISQEKRYSNEYYLYVEDDMSFGALKANVGVHVSGFKVGDKNYIYPQPRLGLRYLVSENWSVKASYANMAQYINLLTNESIGLPTDLWVPSTEKIKPQTSWQSALGVSTTLNKGLELSLEGYYKEMDNVISYKEGSTFYQDTSWEDKITQGKGTAYGMEVLLLKKLGKTTGWLGYTLAWNTRQFDAINSGKVYPYKYDRRHDLELIVLHKFSDKISFSGTWVYGTGNAITLSEASYVESYYDYGDGHGYYNNINILGEKNSFRMPAYHRLDLGVEFLKETSWGERAWTLSVYNAYNNNNPFYVYLGRNNQHEKSYKQISILPIIPAISYRFKF